MRNRRPGGTEERDSCSGLSITVNTVPLAQPGIEMRIESFGTGFSGCCPATAAARPDTSAIVQRSRMATVYANPAASSGASGPDYVIFGNGYV